MSDFGSAVKHLVETTTKGARTAKQREMREAVGEVLRAFDPEDEKAATSALRALGRAIKEASGFGEQVLLLAVGALVESGAPPEAAWPAVDYRLKETFDEAADFARACVDKTDNLDVLDAVRTWGPRLQKKMPRQYEAWEVLRSRSLAAVACLARSSKVRTKARASKDGLIEAAYPLEDAVEEVLFFSHVIKLIDEVPLLVLHPDSRRGWRMVMHDVTTNVDMFVLLLDKLIGDPKKGMLAGTRPNPKAVAVLTDPDASPKKPPQIKVLWNLVAWTGVLPDKTLPDPQSHAHADWVWLEGVPLDIPVFEGERVILFQPPVMVREYEVEPAFSTLSPRIELKSKIPAAEVDRLLAKMAAAAKPIRAKREAAENKARKAAKAQYEAARRR